MNAGNIQGAGRLIKMVSTPKRLNETTSYKTFFQNTTKKVSRSKNLAEKH